MGEALAFLTPLGRARAPGPAALAWFPVVGVLIGAALGVLWWALGLVLPPGLAAAGVVAGDMALTGMLHMDGLVDSADGLFLTGERARRLAAMRDPHVGAFGASAAIAVMLLRFRALDALGSKPLARDVLLLAGIWGLSRGMMGFAAGRLPYARKGGGIASAFRERGMPGGHGEEGEAHDGRLGRPSVGAECSALGSGLLGVVVGACGLVGGLAWPGLVRGAPLAMELIGGAVALVAGIAGAALVLGFGMRRLGGFTGDLLGAAGVVAETVALVVAAARW
jgi:adenosylcobinamide-GDP ribazoletransferase